MLKELCAALLLIATVACGGNKGTAPSPTTTTPPTTAATFSLSGRVTGGSIYTGGSTYTAISGATVSIIDGPNVGRSATTDASGNYNVGGLQLSGFTVNVFAANYVTQSRGVTLTSNQTLNFELTQPPPPIVITGQVTDATTSAPISGAIVSINGRYRTTTNFAGMYSDAGLLDAGSNTNITYVSANNYVSDYRYIRGTTQNVHLNRLERITAGASKLLTVAPDDSLCVNNLQDTPGLGPDYVCRSVRVITPSDGILIVEAISTQSGTHAMIEVETVGDYRFVYPMSNPASIQVTAGTEVVVNVEVPSASTNSQSFIVSTSMSTR
jgi:hypothetical protein